MTLDQTWREWSKVTEPELPKKLFAPAAERHLEQIEKWLKAPPGHPFVVTADSSLEALAFLCCALGQVGVSCPGAHERAVVIRSLAAFRNIAGTSPNFIAIVASPEVEKALAGLHKRTHTIIVRGRNTVTDNADIKLGLLSHEPFREALCDMEFNDTQIDQLARESARSLTVLRRRLAQVEAVKVPLWANDNGVARSMIPFVFVGAWDSSVEADQEILRLLTYNPYDETERTIAQLQTMDEPPVWSIGHLRGVVSKIDALHAAHRVLTKRDLEDFLFAAEVILSEQDPALELPEDRRWAANLYGKSRDHSPALRQGICDSLVLLAVHGNALVGDRLGIDLEAGVGVVVRCLLSPSTASKWLSQKNDLPQYAEAAPDTFLSIIEADLDSDNPQIAALFAPAHTVIFGDCPRSGMLWALELLAWKPERLIRVASILAKMCKWRIDDNWANKPMHTLKSIFQFWMPQTAASLGERNKALEWLAKKFPEVGWQVCADQFGLDSIIGNHCNVPRWRTDARDAGKVTMDGDALQGPLKAIELALDWPEHDERTLGDLVERLEALGADQRERVWELISDWNGASATDGQRAALRERIRRCVLFRHGQHCELDDTEREKARQVYSGLESQNPVVRHQWLFQSPWVQESADEFEDEELDDEKREERIARQRRDALQEVWDEVGLKGILKLCRSGDASKVIGWHMSEICAGVQEVANFVQDIIGGISDDLQDKCEQCISGFLANLDIPERDAALTELLARLGSHEGSYMRILRCAPFDRGTWQHVGRLSKRLQLRYWKEVDVPSLSRHDGPKIATFVDELLNVDRPRAAFHAARMDLELIDSPRLVRLLVEVATKGAEPPTQHRLDRHYLSQALDVLEQRGDTSRDELARLEFLFIKALNRSKHGIRNLEAQLAESPALFMHVLALCYRRNDGGADPAEWRAPNENREAVAGDAHAFLTSAGRIPGTRPDGSIDLKVLRNWLEQARALAREYGRAKIGDQMIGRLLSHCPLGDDGIWPCEPVREAIDDLGSQDIATGMLVGIRNPRGVTWRGVGGNQEHKLAEQYREWSRKVAFEHPFTARMLELVGSSYDRDARRWDDQDSVRERMGH